MFSRHRKYQYHDDLAFRFDLPNMQELWLRDPFANFCFCGSTSVPNCGHKWPMWPYFRLPWPWNFLKYGHNFHGKCGHIWLLAKICSFLAIFGYFWGHFGQISLFNLTFTKLFGNEQIFPIIFMANVAIFSFWQKFAHF